VVDDVDDDGIAELVSPYVDGHLGRGAGVAQGVGDEVLDHPLEQRGVGEDEGSVSLTSTVTDAFG